MHPKLIAELNKPQLDYMAIRGLILEGVPVRQWFKIVRHDSVGIFDSHLGQNIFHYLSKSDAVLYNILQNLFPSQSNTLAKWGYTLGNLVDSILDVNSGNWNSDEFTLILKTILRNEEVGKEFFTNVIKNGRVDVMQKICDREKLNALYPYFKNIVTIVENVVKTDVETEEVQKAHNVFSVLFSKYPLEIISSMGVGLPPVMKLMLQINNNIFINQKELEEKKRPKQSAQDDEHEVELDQAIAILDSKIFVSQELASNLLNICSRRFIEGTLSNMKLSELTDLETFTELQKAVLDTFVAKLEEVPALATEANEVVDGAATTDVTTQERDRAGDPRPALEASQPVERLPDAAALVAPESAAEPIGVTIHDYAAQVQEILQNSEGYQDVLQEEGIHNCQLQTYIYLFNKGVADDLGGAYLQQFLEPASELLQIECMSPKDFIEQYIIALKDSDEILKLNDLNQNALDFAYENKIVDITELLLSRVSVLGITISSFFSLINNAIENNDNGMIRSLFAVSSNDSSVNWYDILVNAMRCNNNASLEVINYYTLSNSGAVREVKSHTDGGIPNYNILNKALNYLGASCKLFLYPDSDLKASELDQSQREFLAAQTKETSSKEIVFFCNIVKGMLKQGKIYYGQDQAPILEKTFSLLDILVSYTGRVKGESIIDDVNNIRDSIIQGIEALNLGTRCNLAIASIRHKIKYPFTKTSMASQATQLPFADKTDKEGIIERRAAERSTKFLDVEESLLDAHCGVGAMEGRGSAVTVGDNSPVRIVGDDSDNG